jgi:16S rRNA G966 N2-methylase RsmD
MLSKLFPLVDYSKIKYDNEGLYSITHPNDADKISKLLISLYESYKSLSILDGTGGIGGNTISFGKHFTNVTSIELNNDRCEMLENNVKIFDLSNVTVVNTNSVKYMYENLSKYDIFFFDPPWGGPDYKKQTNLRLKMDSLDLDVIIDNISNKVSNKLIVFKLPFNYDFEQFSNYNYKLYEINKYYIIIILL